MNKWIKLYSDRLLLRVKTRCFVDQEFERFIISVIEDAYNAGYDDADLMRCGDVAEIFDGDLDA